MKSEHITNLNGEKIKIFDIGTDIINTESYIHICENNPKFVFALKDWKHRHKELMNLAFKIDTDTENVMIDCPYCDNWESMGIDDPRKNFNEFEFDWIGNSDRRNELSLTTCTSCNNEFLLEWDYDNISYDDVEDFERIFKPIYGLSSEFTDEFGGMALETYGNDLQIVKGQLAKKPKTVWTLVEGENEAITIESGFHVVNRLAYIITKKEFDKPTSIPYFTPSKLETE